MTGGEERTRRSAERSRRERQQADGRDGRSERRALRGAARRRKIRRRLWLASAPVVVLIVVVVVLLVLFGGPDEDLVAEESSTTTASTMTGDRGAALLVTEQDTLQAAIVFGTREATGLMLVVPAITLLLNDDRFATAADIYAAEGDSQLAAVLAGQLGVAVTSAARVSWTELHDGLASLGVSGLPVALGEPAGAVALSEAIRRVTSEDGALRFTGLWDGLDLEGDSSGFKEVLRASGDGVRWTAAAVSGEIEQGDGFTYLEPDLRAARALLAASANDGAITVELQNGSGDLGVLEAAAAQLQPLGFRLSKVGNSEDFPDAAQTRIVFSLGLASAAARIQALLGVGTISEDSSLKIDRIIVVLGKDYAPLQDDGTG